MGKEIVIIPLASLLSLYLPYLQNVRCFCPRQQQSQAIGTRMRTTGLASPVFNLGNGNELIWISPYELVKLPSHSHAQTNASNDIMRMDCQTRHLFPSSSHCCVSLNPTTPNNQNHSFVRIRSLSTITLNPTHTTYLYQRENRCESDYQL